MIRSDECQSLGQPCHMPTSRYRCLRDASAETRTGVPIPGEHQGRQGLALTAPFYSAVSLRHGCLAGSLVVDLARLLHLHNVSFSPTADAFDQPTERPSQARQRVFDLGRNAGVDSARHDAVPRVSTSFGQHSFPCEIDLTPDSRYITWLCRRSEEHTS